MDDDGSGWHELLVATWTPRVRAAVVARIERATVGRRGWFVRALVDPEVVPAAWTETLHALILAAIHDETGADLDALGSQAAWECYEQVWDALADRWRSGGSLATVPLGEEPTVVSLIRALPPEAAAHAAADVRGVDPDPLWIAGRLRVDIEGLEAYTRLDGGRVPKEVASVVAAIVRRVGSR